MKTFLACITILTFTITVLCVPFAMALVIYERTMDVPMAAAVMDGLITLTFGVLSMFIGTICWTVRDV